ncbi:unnamed protein product, partial [Meganyctiphanes norvegica]
CSMLLLLICVNNYICAEFGSQNILIRPKGPATVKWAAGQQNIPEITYSSNSLTIPIQKDIFVRGTAVAVSDILICRIPVSNPFSPNSSQIAFKYSIQNSIQVDGVMDDLDDLRHYAYEGDTMSIASLSSIGSESTDNEDILENVAEWGDGFKKLAEIYSIEEETDEDEDSEFEFPEPPKKPSRTPQPPLTFNELGIPPIDKIFIRPPPPVEEYSLPPLRDNKSTPTNNSSNNSTNNNPRIISGRPKSGVNSTTNTGSSPQEYNGSSASISAHLLPQPVYPRPLSVRQSDNQLLVNNRNLDQLQPETHPLLSAEDDRRGWDENDEFLCT